LTGFNKILPIYIMNKIWFTILPTGIDSEKIKPVSFPEEKSLPIPYLAWSMLVGEMVFIIYCIVQTYVSMNWSKSLFGITT
jgi:hypothetical protein